MTSRDIVMGRVIVPYGIKGWLKIQPFTLAPDTLLEYRQWRLQRPPQTESTLFEVREGRPHGAFLVVSLTGVDTREDAAKLRGMLISVPRELLPELAEGEFYYADLVGLRVVNRDGVLLGEVNAVQDYGAQPILHITPAVPEHKTEILIPYVDAYIDAVDLETKEIRVDFRPEWNT